MNAKITKVIIKSITAIAVAAIGVFAGIKIDQRNTQMQINEVMGDVINVSGDENDITINDIETFMKNYLQLQSDYESLNQQNDSLVAQNTKYFDDLAEAKNKIESYENQSNSKVQELEQQLDNMPDVQFKDIGLSINGDVIPVNSTKSSAIIDNRIYYSDEFVKNLVDPNYGVTIQDNIMYIGKIIKEKSSLSDEWVLNSSGIYHENNMTDSYGNTHTNVLRFRDRSCSIIYNLNNEYSLLKCSLAICSNAKMDKTGVITIKADDEIVYTSPLLTKTTEPFTKEDIPINNCKLLTIEYDTASDYNECIMDNIIVYN